MIKRKFFCTADKKYAEKTKKNIEGIKKINKRKTNEFLTETFIFLTARRHQKKKKN